MTRRIVLLAVSLVVSFFFIAGSCKKVPTDPIKPIGRTTSFKYSTETYATMSTEPGRTIKYAWVWGDNTFDTTELFASGETVEITHTWMAEGSYKVKARAIDDRGVESKGYSEELTVTVGPNNRPNPPGAIAGLAGGIKKQPIVWSTSATDPDGDSVYIIFYTDTTDLISRSKNSGWLGPVPSGRTVTWDAATYAKNGTFYAYAKAKDTKGAISNPGPVKEVVIAPMEVRWSFQTEDGDAFNSSPAMLATATDTTLYIGSDGVYFYALNAKSGASRGKFMSFNEDAWSSTPALNADGSRVYMADDGGWLYAFRTPGLSSPYYYPPTNQPQPGMTPFYSAPAVSGNNIYIGNDDGYLYHFQDNGSALSLVGRYRTGIDISSSPAISPDGSKLVFGNDSGFVYCLSASNIATRLWRRALGAPITSSPAISTDGIVYIGCDDNYLYSLNLATGQDARPPLLADDFITSSPVIDAAGNVFFVTDNGTVYGFLKSGTVWTKTLEFGDNVSATPCLAPDTSLIINTDDGAVYGIDIRPTSSPPLKTLYYFPLPEPEKKLARGRKSASLSSSVTVGLGNFYVGSSNGGVCGVTVDKPSFVSSGLPSGQWPKFRHDLRNSGFGGVTQQ